MLCFIRRYFSVAQNGIYQIKTDTATGFTKVHCQMTSLAGCPGGGWTMVMKINGTKVGYTLFLPNEYQALYS